MELQQIHAFLTVAEELHFGRAAERLGMAQPPLSRTIRQFEREMGAELFHRTTRQVALAPAGEALLGPARALLDAAVTAEQSVRFAAAGDIGRVRLGFGSYSSHRLATKLTLASHARRPGITMDLESGIYTDAAIERLLDGSLDLALVRWQIKPPTIAGRPVHIEEPVVLLFSEHPLANRESLRVEELEDENFLILPPNPGSTMRELTLQWCHRAGFSPRIVQEAPDSWIIGSLVSEKMGIAITYDTVAASFNHENLVTVPLDVEHDPIVVYLAHRNPPSGPAVREVLAAAESALPTIEV